MEGHGIPVGVPESEHEPERALRRSDDDGDALCGKLAVDLLDIVRCQPEHDTRPRQGWTPLGSKPGRGSRTANAMGAVSKTTAWGGPEPARRSPSRVS